MNHPCFSIFSKKQKYTLEMNCTNSHLTKDTILKIFVQHQHQINTETQYKTKP
ncbi:hypothetical protein LguiA_006019 [Lonicera macranthoides]